MTYRMRNILRVHHVSGLGRWLTVGAMCLGGGTGFAAGKETAPAPPIDPQSLKFLKELVEIPSGTAMPAGLSHMRARIREEFAPLGLNATEVDGTGERKVLVLERDDAKPRILLVGHIDTVFNNPNQAPKLTISDLKLRGPGVIDMKGGIVVIHKALKELAAQGKTHVLKAVRIVLNDDEETGSKDTKTVLRNQAEGCHSALVFEPGLADGSLVTAHSGIKWLKMTVHGKAAHAGLEPEKGLNACVELGHKLTRLGSLSDMSRHLTVTPSVIEGGTTPNTVCETASVKLDIRYVRDKDRDQVLRDIRAIANQTNTANDLLGIKPTADIQDLVDIPPMKQESTHSLMDLARKVGANMRQKLGGQPVGYASDGNQLAPTGIRLLVGLGPYGGGMHSQEEFMDARSFTDRVILTMGILEALATDPQGKTK